MNIFRNWNEYEAWVFIYFIYLPTEKSKKQRKTATKNFDDTTIADRLRMVSWVNNSHPTGVVKPVYGIPTLPLTTKAV